MVAQDYWSKRIDFGGGNDEGVDIQIIPDKGLLIQPSALCEINTIECTGLIMIDDSGEVLWRSIVYDTLDTNYPEAMFVLNDTILLNTNYERLQNDSLNYAILFFNTQGEVIDRFDYFAPGLKGYRFARSLTGAFDRTYVSLGASVDLSIPAREFTRAYDRSWNLLWEVDIPNTYPIPRLCNVKPTLDSGIVMSYSSRDLTDDDYIVTVEKYDSKGEMQWQTILPHIGGYPSTWNEIEPSPAGGYIGLWQFDTSSLYITQLPTLIFKLDENGDVEWERLNLNEQIGLLDIFPSSRGGYIGCGVAENWRWDSNDPEYEVGYVLKLSEKGDVEWDRKIVDEREGAYQYGLFSGAEYANSDLVFTGRIIDSIFGFPGDETPANIWALKLDSMGCLNPGCGEWQYIMPTSTDNTHINNHKNFVVFPNPAKDVVYIGKSLFAGIRDDEYTAILYDISGRVVMERDFYSSQIIGIDVSTFNPGQYFISVLGDGSTVHFDQFIIVR